VGLIQIFNLMNNKLKDRSFLCYLHQKLNTPVCVSVSLALYVPTSFLLLSFGLITTVRCQMDGQMTFPPIGLRSSIARDMGCKHMTLCIASSPLRSQ